MLCACLARGVSSQISGTGDLLWVPQRLLWHRLDLRLAVAVCCALVLLAGQKDSCHIWQLLTAGRPARVQEKTILRVFSYQYIPRTPFPVWPFPSRKAWKDMHGQLNWMSIIFRFVCLYYIKIFSFLVLAWYMNCPRIRKDQKRVFVLARNHTSKLVYKVSYLCAALVFP